MIWLALITACTDVSSTDDTSSPTATTATTGASGDTGTPHPCGAASLRLGRGIDTHVPLDDGDGVVLVHGPQNGWHVDLSAELRRTSDLMGFDASVVVVDSGVRIAGDQPATFVSLVRVDECVAQTSGLRFLVDDVKEPKGGYQAFICSLDDLEIDIELTGTDLDTKAVLSDRRRARVVLDKVDATYHCPSD